MNENIDLTKILKDYPEGTKLYSTIHGEVTLIASNYTSQRYQIEVRLNDNTVEIFTSEGKLLNKFDGECILFPSKTQRDWSKFTAPWFKKGRFDPKTLNVFDKVLAKMSNEYYCTWFADFVAEPSHEKNETPLILGAKEADMVIPYNDDTKHLAGTIEEAPEYYRYWEE